MVRASKKLWKEFRATVEEAGLTVTTLAAELEISTQLLVNYLQRAQSIPPLRAKEILRVVGWPETKWPRVTPGKKGKPH